jgi:hypothetical protein
VNVRPKTSSSGGVSSFGVVVFVTESLVISTSNGLVPEAALAWMLYDLVRG